MVYHDTFLISGHVQRRPRPFRLPHVGPMPGGPLTTLTKQGQGRVQGEVLEPPKILWENWKSYGKIYGIYE